MQRLLCAAVTLLTGLITGGAAQPVAAEPAPVVIELFTSQGCSACPPADKFLAELAGRDDVIALGLHVDYWDYIGWADSFAKPEFTQRQRRYAYNAGSTKVYTPEMIIGGTTRVAGNRAMPVMDAIQRKRAVPSPIELRLDRDAETLRVRAQADPALEAPVDVQVVQYQPSRSVSIESGENEGRRITYANVVTHWDNVTVWDGAAALDLEVAVERDSAVVAILQRTGQERIVAAARAPD